VASFFLEYLKFKPVIFPKIKKYSKERWASLGALAQRFIKVKPFGFLKKSPHLLCRVVFFQKTLTKQPSPPDTRLSFFFFFGFFFSLLKICVRSEAEQNFNRSYYENLQHQNLSKRK
jgi:hypothetical protein